MQHQINPQVTDYRAKIYYKQNQRPGKHTINNFFEIDLQAEQSVFSWQLNLRKIF